MRNTIAEAQALILPACNSDKQIALMLFVSHLPEILLIAAEVRRVLYA